MHDWLIEEAKKHREKLIQDHFFKDGKPLLKKIYNSIYRYSGIQKLDSQW